MDHAPPVRWAVLWRSDNALDGRNRHIRWDMGRPLLFRTRSEAREFIEENFGYIRARPDLQAEPCGWKMPVPIRVRVILDPVEPEA
jgi:hypothetical protein